MSRRDILEDTLARLEAERYAPMPPRPRRGGYRDPPKELTAEQQAHNRDVLMDALDSYPHTPVDDDLANLRISGPTRSAPRLSRRRSA